MVLSSPPSSGEFDHVQARAAALAHLRKESLNLYNRLHSIEEDIEFINEVRSFYPQLPILRMSPPSFRYRHSLTSTFSELTLWRVVCGPLFCS